VRNKAVIAVVLSVLSLTSVSVFAHHGNAAYDYEKTVTVKGTVTDWVFANPHSWLKMDVNDDKGNVQHWVLEAYGAEASSASGVTWRKTSLKPGDSVTVEVMPTKNGAAVGRVRRVLDPNGKVIIAGPLSSGKNDIATPQRKPKPDDPNPDTGR
jgi:hypothetical protein